MPRQICLKRKKCDTFILSLVIIPFINPIINPDDILLIKGIPKLVIVRDATV